MLRLQHVLLAVAMTLGLRATGATPDEIVLVQDQQPVATIVIALAASPPALQAAKDLQRSVQRISTAQLTIVREDKLTAQERAGTLVLVGDSDLTRACNVQVGALPPEGFVIKTQPGRLILAGRDDALNPKRGVSGEGRVSRSPEYQQGTAFAVSAFLEEQLGMRWLWPGQLGEVAPRRSTVGVGPLDRRDAPRLKQRIVRDALVSSRYELARKRLEIEPGALAEMRAESGAWLRRLRTGRSVDWQYQHGFIDWWERYHEKHPEFLARHLNGSREWPARLGDLTRVKICISNPAVLEEYLARARNFFDQHPQAASVSASPNDNGFSGHCLCTNCEAWDAPEGRTIELFTVDASGQRVTLAHPALSDRYLRFYNRAAERLQTVAPGKMIGGYAYAAWLTPPLREKVASNVLISVVAFNHLTDSEIAESRTVWDGWSHLTSNLVLRPNLMHYGHGYPLNYTHWLGETMRHCADTGMIGSYWDTLQHHWAAQGLNYYVLARLLWNPFANVDAIIEDYCRAGFGTAAPAMQAYFDALERVTSRVRTLEATRQSEFVVDTLPIYSLDTLKHLQEHLMQARELAAKDETVLARIAFVETALDYVRLQTRAVRFIRENEWRAASLAVAGREQLYRHTTSNFAIGSPALITEELERRSVFFLNERLGPR